MTDTVIPDRQNTYDPGCGRGRARCESAGAAHLKITKSILQYKNTIQNCTQQLKYGSDQRARVPCFCCDSCCGCDDEADYEVTCPQCGEVVPVYEDDLSFGNIICPGCGETLEFDFDETDEPDGED